MNDVVGGQVDFYFPGLSGAVPLMQGGKIKLLAVSSAKRSPAAPDIPTVAEVTGIANFDFTLWVGFFGPRGMPMDLATQLNAEINKIMLEPEIKARLQNDGAEVRILSIDQFAGFVQRRDRQIPGDHQGGGYQGGVKPATPFAIRAMPQR